MKVKIISHTPKPDIACYIAALQCRNILADTDIENIRLQDKCEPYQVDLLHRCIKSGHMSILEHATYQFHIAGVSRALSHQLVRHRIGSYSQLSQRTVKKFTYVVPETIQKDITAVEIYTDIMRNITNIYEELLQLGIPQEDARYVLPNACKTQLVVSMNVRSLYNFFELRCCEKAQWEIRYLAKEMLRLCKEDCSTLFRYAGRHCDIYGECLSPDNPCNRKGRAFNRFIWGEINE